MKKIGVLGGMSWESSHEFYRQLNVLVKERLGGLHSASLVMSSVDFGPIAEAMNERRWNDIAAQLVEEARALERAGADFFLIASNTMHRMAVPIAGAVSIPFLHIVDVTGEALRVQGVKSIGLLGTRFTMEDGFWAERMERNFGIRVLVPEAEDRALVNRVIFDELCLGVVKDDSRARYVEVVSRLAARGAEGVVLGCTEIAMLLTEKDVSVPLFDTTRLHAQAAVDRALEEVPAQAAAALGLAT
jgi:aspartate racemase